MRSSNEDPMTMLRLQRSRLWRAEDGVGAIEFAFVAGILTMLLLGICDFGIGFWEKMQVGNAARAGAQYAVKNGYDSTNIATAVTNATNLAGVQASPAPSQACGCPNAASGITPSTCGAVCPNGDIAGTYVTVSAQVSYRTLFAWPGLPTPMTLVSSATVRTN
jgi:Flp pilus assembly protein TadG